MKQFLLGAALATAVLGAAGFAVLKEPVADAAVKKTMPLKLSDLTLDRAFRLTAPIGANATPTVLPATSNQGFIITEIAVPTGVSAASLTISINGAQPETIPLGAPIGGGAPLVFRDANPPIIVRPGDSISIGQNVNISPIAFTLGGYFVYPGEV